MSYFTETGAEEVVQMAPDYLNKPTQAESVFAKAGAGLLNLFTKPVETITGKTTAELTKTTPPAALPPMPPPTKTSTGAVMWTDPITGKRFKTREERDAFTRAQVAGKSRFTAPQMIIGAVGLGVSVLTVVALFKIARKK